METHNTIGLKERNCSIRQHLYRARQWSREVLCANIDKQLDAVVSKSAQSEWVSHIVVPAKSDGNIPFCADYRRVNAAAIPSAYPLLRMDYFNKTLEEAHVSPELDGLWEYWRTTIKMRTWTRLNLPFTLVSSALLLRPVSYATHLLRSNSPWILSCLHSAMRCV